jgi:hypothetical protein
VHSEALYTTQVKIVRADREALSDPVVRGSNCRGAQDTIQNPQPQLMILGIIKFVTQYSRSQMPNCWNANVVKNIYV